MKKWLLSFAAFVFSLHSHAQDIGLQENASSLKDSVISIDEVTVHAFHYERRLKEVPAAISILSAKQLEQSALQSIDFVLNQVPGVYMQSASLTTNRLTIRGIGSRTPYASNKIRAYYAGIPLTNGVGETSIEDLNQSVLSSVEIIKGPASGFYGAGLGGTLLFQTIHPTQNRLVVDYGVGSHQTREFNGNLYLTGKNSSNQLSIEQLNSAGYRDNNATDRVNLNYVGQFKIGKHQLNLLVNHTDLKAFIPSSLNMEMFTTHPQQAAANWGAIRGYEDYQKTLMGASLISSWINNWRSTLSVFGLNRTADELRPFNFLTEENHYYGGRFVLEKTIATSNGNWKLMLGNESFWEGYDWETLENTSDKTTGKSLSDNQEERNYINIFGQIEYLLADQLRISAGVNLNKTRYNYTDLLVPDGNQSGQHTFNTILSPRVAINYSLSKNHNLYAQMSHGFSPPSLEETLLPEGSRNTGIQPETGWNYELGSRGYLFDKLYYDISAYFMVIKNLLVARRVGEDAYLGINAGKTAHPGLEYYFQYKLPTAGTNWRHQLIANGSYSPYYFVDFVDGENDYSNKKLTGTPRYQTNFSYVLSLKQWARIQLHYQQVGRIPLRDDNSVHSDAYGLLNANLQFLKSWGKLQAKALFAMNNLADTHYSSMVLINASSFGGNAPRYYYPGTPRNLSFRLKLAYLF
ncbi:TonB-dependent receptor [Sunxiuqinia sp. sy24]|uniref:TonB-dependent receptor n=1 Tax=Sunxiuqinia sp. sy24 TaxID=3461495 RepID=UPI0040462903